MMKISCEIIKDLLPLYHDAVCSKDSRMLVEDHITHCENCKIELQEMDSILSENFVKENLNEAGNIRKLSRKWKHGMLISLGKGFLIAAIIALIVYCFVGIQIV